MKVKKEYTIDKINDIKLDIKPWDIVFMKWDLAAWKTTFSQHIINNILWVKEYVNSPTYTYYNKYLDNVYHFDLYRLQNYDEFFAIWGEDILDDENNIIILEWPELIEDFYKPTHILNFIKTDNENTRILEIEIFE